MQVMFLGVQNIFVKKPKLSTDKPRTFFNLKKHLKKVGCLKLSYHPVADLKVSFRKEELTSKESNFYERRECVYGFNSQEVEKELNSSITSAEFWFYDGRLGRRWNTDPVIKFSESLYSCFGNTPIWASDPLGNDTITISTGKESSVKFYHADFEKRTIDMSYLELDKSKSKFVDLSGVRAPDAIGYSVEISGKLKGGFSFGGKIAANYTIFTKGEYSWQPYKYFYAGVAAGVGSPEASISGNISPFVAWTTNSDKDLRPDSWEGGFRQISSSLSAYAGVGGNLGSTYFESKNKSWSGLSLDIGLGLGGGGGFATEGAYTYYKRAEVHITKTKLMTATRLAAKWADMATIGMIPGTAISDAEQSVTLGWEKTKKEAKKWASDWPALW